MRHLTPAELVDLAEGARDDASTPHLATCMVCRRELADLRALMSIGAENDVRPAGAVPEPSPLFWDHLSARVRESVQTEPLPPRAAFFLPWPRAAAAALGCAIVVAVVAAIGSRVTAPGSQTAIAPPSLLQVEAIHDGQVLPTPPLGSTDDPSFTLVADYGRTLDWDELREQLGVATHDNGMDATVGELNAGERQELHRLLKEELARPAAPADRS